MLHCLASFGPGQVDRTTEISQPKNASLSAIANNGRLTSRRPCELLNCFNELQNFNSSFIKIQILKFKFNKIKIQNIKIQILILRGEGGLEIFAFLKKSSRYLHSFVINSELKTCLRGVGFGRL